MTPEQQRLVQRGLPLVELIARRVARRVGARIELEELLAIGRVALVEIVAEFESQKGGFELFAGRRLTWAIYDSIRTNKRGLLRARARALAASQQYAESLRDTEPPRAASLDDVPTEEESQAKLANLLEGHAAAMALALTSAHNDVDRATDSTANPEESFARAEIADSLRRAVRELPERERTLVERHYYGEERFDRIATDLGISKAWASRLHATAIDLLAKHIRAALGLKRAAG
jgi:RNA polymerase sigma factor for flagellar operon FliA